MNPFLDESSGLYLQIGKIRSASLGYEDHEILTIILDVDYGGSSQMVGGFLLAPVDEGYGTPKPRARPGAMDYIIGIMRACGVRRWEDVAGRTVFFAWKSATAWNTMPAGIKNLPTERGELFLFEEVEKLSRQDK
jgi:hypothetical protein